MSRSPEQGPEQDPSTPPRFDRANLRKLAQSLGRSDPPPGGWVLHWPITLLVVLLAPLLLPVAVLPMDHTGITILAFICGVLASGGCLWGSVSLARLESQRGASGGVRPGTHRAVGERASRGLALFFGVVGLLVLAAIVYPILSLGSDRPELLGVALACGTLLILAGLAAAVYVFQQSLTQQAKAERGRSQEGRDDPLNEALLAMLEASLSDQPPPSPTQRTPTASEPSEPRSDAEPQPSPEPETTTAAQAGANPRSGPDANTEPESQPSSPLATARLIEPFRPSQPAAKRSAPLPEVDSVFDAELWRSLQEHLKSLPNTEQGGFLLGYRRDGRFCYTAAVFPEQVRASGTICEFSTADMAVARQALDELEDEPGIERLEKFSWLHTHPNLSVFLSGTDRQTLTQIAGLDPDPRAVVVDVFQSRWEDQVGVFNKDFKSVSAATAELGLPAELPEKFRQALERAYHGGQKQARPRVFFAGELTEDDSDQTGQDPREELAALLAGRSADELQGVLQLVRQQVGT